MSLRSRPLNESDVERDPLAEFRKWYAEADAHTALADAVALATATRDGRPSARMVLLKRADERGYVFYSNYESRKGRELASNPHAALLFYWHELGRQVRIEGRVERLGAEESDVYFDSRPLESRLSNIVSPQSEPIAGRAELEARREQLRHTRLSRPSAWGGYVLVPELYEFWQHRENRLHDRLSYRLVDEEWVLERLAP